MKYFFIVGSFVVKNYLEKTRSEFKNGPKSIVCPSVLVQHEKIIYKNDEPEPWAIAEENDYIFCACQSAVNDLSEIVVLSIDGT